MKRLVSKEISDDKVYHFLDDIRTIQYKNSILVVCVPTGNWIVLDNDVQMEYFSLLRNGFNIGAALGKIGGNINDAQKVIVQIEAKRFEAHDVLTNTPEFSLHIHLTNLCNLRCPHCYMFAGSSLNNELATDEIISLLDAFRSYDGKKATFTGGEISMRKDLYTIIRHSSDLGIRNELLTNGTLWTEKQINEFSPLIDKVQISIDGYSEESNAIVRGKGNFAKSLKAIDLFVKNGVRTEVAITPFFDESYRKNYMRYARFGNSLMDKYKDYNFKVKYSGVILDGRDVSFTKEEREEYKKIAEKIYNSLYGDVDQYQFIQFHKKLGIQDNCNYGNLTITADGNLYLCPQIPMIESFGNLRDKSFEEIIQVIKKAKNISNVDNILPCKYCELKYICGGDCRIENFPKLAQSDIMGLSTPPTRSCSKEIKEKFYNLMIETNEKIFQDTGC